MTSTVNIEYITTGPHTVRLVITPSMSGVSRKEIEVTSEQAERVRRWHQGKGLIQDMLYDFDSEMREMLMTGMDDAEWLALFGGDEDDENEQQD